MTDISKEAVDALCLRLVVNDDYDILVAVQALRAALDEAEARAVKAEAERDAANAVVRMVDAWGNGLRHHTAHESAMVKAARTHLGAKP